MSQYNFELNLCSEPKFSVFWNLEVFETCMFGSKQKVWSNGDSIQIFVVVLNKLFTLILKFLYSNFYR